jgi:sugar phosphate isomerase/epimerase
VAPEIVQPLVQQYALPVSAVGTGSGWIVHRWHFTHEDAAIRRQARDYARRLVEAAGALGAPAIIGSMQGRYEGEVTRPQALDWLREALAELAPVAEQLGQPLLYEPLNRYETNLFNRLVEAAEFLGTLGTRNVKLLADLFHMGIEETSIPLALRAACRDVGYFHFADSNRHAIGFGHTDVVPVIAALREMEYEGFISGEVLPLPDSLSAAAQTMRAYRRFVLGEEEEGEQ